MDGLQHLRWVLLAIGWLASTAVAQVPAWRQVMVPVPSAGYGVPVLVREPATEPAIRVIVVMGSGCSGMGPVADRYFSGLEAAQVWVLHKPYTRPWVARSADDCDRRFTDYDRHSRWLRDASHAVQTLRSAQGSRPTWLVGISEGTDLLPGLASLFDDSLSGLVLLSASGLDPADVLGLQADRLGEQARWNAIQAAAAGPAGDDQRLEGRTLGYWRDLLAWRLFEPLTALPLTVVHWWGDKDDLIPPEAHLAFEARAAGTSIRLNSRRWVGADHGLHHPEHGSLQRLLWARLLGADGPAPQPTRPSD